MHLCLSFSAVCLVFRCHHVRPTSLFSCIRKWTSWSSHVDEWKSTLSSNSEYHAENSRHFSQSHVGACPLPCNCLGIIHHIFDMCDTRCSYQMCPGEVGPPFGCMVLVHRIGRTSPFFFFFANSDCSTQSFGEIILEMTSGGIVPAQWCVAGRALAFD